MGRELSDAERTVLRHVLIDHPTLRAQVDRTEVVRHWAPESPSIDLHVPDDVPPYEASSSPLSFGVVDEVGAFTGWLLVWLENGRLAALEYAWVTDEPPAELPPPQHIGEDPVGEAQ